ncbi:MAG: hypothetical protein JW776_10840 [Candidatus Lokiarchaeota archaeon]|nr:hypothetical protein [Candidatus Lokiarchaeota archaeon]
MIKKRTFYSLIPVLVIIGLVVFPTFGLCKTRREYTIDFILSTEDDVWGSFSEFNQYEDSNDEIETIMTTKSALGGLYLLDATDEADIDKVRVWLRDRTNWGMDLEMIQNSTYGIEGLYYIDNIDYWNGVNNFKEFASNFTEIYGDAIGYTMELGLNASIAGTYLIVKSYYLMDVIEDLEITNITNFITGLLHTDGGFKYSPTATESSLTSTYQAIQTLWYLGTLSEFENKTLVHEYVSQFYVDDVNSVGHYGGFSYNPESELPFATVRATYEAVMTLYSIGFSVQDQQATLDWILSNQNPDDGGFSENVLLGTERRSSTITTHQALSILNNINPELSALSEQFGDYKLRWWIVLIIVLVVLGAAITGVILYQRRIKL